MSLTNFKGDLSVGGTLSLSETGGILSNSSSASPIVSIGTNEFLLDEENNPLNWTGLLNNGNYEITLFSSGPDKTESSRVSSLNVSPNEFILSSSTANFNSVGAANETGNAMIAEAIFVPEQIQMVVETLSTTTVGTPSTYTGTSISLTSKSMLFRYVNSSNSSGCSFGLDSSGVSASGPLNLDSGKIISDGNGTLSFGSGTKMSSTFVCFPNCTYANLPSSPSIGMSILVTNALKPGETTGSGTGCLCVYDGSNWINISTGTTVTV